MAQRIRKVAVIGAGISGVVSGSSYDPGLSVMFDVLIPSEHLLAQGLDVTIFERSSGFGGVWSERSRTLQMR